MNLQQLRYVNFLAHYKHFGKTAEALSITQPTLSQQILSLEKELGITLFVRSHKGVSLTDAGTEFVRRSESICNQVDDLKTAMMEYSDLCRGKIRIGVMPAFSYLDIINMITAFRKKFKGIDIEIIVQPSSQLLAGLLDRSYDAVFMTHIAGAPMDDGVEIVTLSSSRLALLLPIDHPLVGLTEISITALNGQNLVVPVEGSPVRDELEKYFIYYGVRPNIICESSNVDTLFRCVQNHLGCACIDYSLAKGLLTEEVVLRVLSPHIKRDICFAVLRSHGTIPSLKVFRDHILDMSDEKKLAARMK